MWVREACILVSYENQVLCEQGYAKKLAYPNTKHIFPIIQVTSYKIARKKMNRTPFLAQFLVNFHK